MSWGVILYLVSNLIIVSGYLFIGWVFGRHLDLRSVWGRFAVVRFFGLCAVTHLDLAYHAASGTPLTSRDIETLYHVVVHLAQAQAVWEVIWHVGRERINAGEWPPHMGFRRRGEIALPEEAESEAGSE